MADLFLNKCRMCQMEALKPRPLHEASISVRVFAFKRVQRQCGDRVTLAALDALVTAGEIARHR